MSGSLIRKVALALVGLALVLGFARGALTKFQQQRQAIIAKAEAERNRLGINDRKTLYAKYPTPEIGLVTAACLAPGETGEVILKGQFPPGTKVLFDSDRIEVLRENITPTEYRATVKVPPDITPMSVRIEVITPVSAAYANRDNVIVITGKYEWLLKAANGWRIRAFLLEDNRCQSENGKMKYTVEFYRGAETKPFETRTATLHYDQYTTGRPYNFDIEEEAAGGNAQKEMEEIARKFQSGNLSDAEMTKLMARMEQIQQELQAEYAKMASPDYIRQLEEKKQQFGCEDMYLKVTGTQVDGYLRCSEKVGSEIALTGTIKYMGR